MPASLLTNFDETVGGLRRVISKNWLDVGDDPDHVKFGLRSRLKLPWRRFALSGCFLLSVQHYYLRAFFSYNGSRRWCISFTCFAPE